MFTCPVCAYNKMPYPPEDFEICPCCGVEFGYHDHRKSHKQLRDEWLARGAPWFNPLSPPPQNWNPLLQLLNAGYEFDLPNDPSTETTVRQVPARERLLTACVALA
jgi:hypothetical protein